MWAAGGLRRGKAWRRDASGPVRAGRLRTANDFPVLGRSGTGTLTGVNDADCKPLFALTAKLNKLTIGVVRPRLWRADIKKLEAAMKGKD